MAVDNYDLVLEYLLSEGYSHNEATRIMVDEDWRQKLLNFVSGRLKTPFKTALTDLTTTAISLTPGQSVKPAVSLQTARSSAPIVRQAAVKPKPKPAVTTSTSVVNPTPKGGVVTQIMNWARRSIVPTSKSGSVTRSANPASRITNTSSGSSVATGSGSSQVAKSGKNVSTPGGALDTAGPVIDVQPILSGTPSVQRISSGKVRNFKPSVTSNPTLSGSTGSTGSTGSINPNKSALVAAGLLALSGDTKQTTGLTKAQRDSKLAQQRAETQAASQPEPEPRGERSAATNAAKQERAKISARRLSAAARDFDRTFAAKRAELERQGKDPSSGVFTWRGKQYNTKLK